MLDRGGPLGSQLRRVGAQLEALVLALRVKDLEEIAVRVVAAALLLHNATGQGNLTLHHMHGIEVASNKQKKKKSMKQGGQGASKNKMLMAIGVVSAGWIFGVVSSFLLVGNKSIDQQDNVWFH